MFRLTFIYILAAAFSIYFVILNSEMDANFLDMFYMSFTGDFDL